MFVVLRYVDKKGSVIERFLGLVHVSDTCAKHSLSLARVCGQGYDGASNIQGEFNGLSQALQRHDQDIVNAIALVRICKERLQSMRDDGWHALLNEVSMFFEKKNIRIPNMDDALATQGRSKGGVQKISNLHHYQVELFYEVNDRQLQELSNRFNEVNTELLLCVSSLNPRDSFFAFEKEKLIYLAKFYRSEFSPVELMRLDDALDNFIIDVGENMKTYCVSNGLFTFEASFDFSTDNYNG